MGHIIIGHRARDFTYRMLVSWTIVYLQPGVEVVPQLPKEHLGCFCEPAPKSVIFKYFRKGKMGEAVSP
jgi:hypothetical protein